LHNFGNDSRSLIWYQFKLKYVNTRFLPIIKKGKEAWAGFKSGKEYIYSGFRFVASIIIQKANIK